METINSMHYNTDAINGIGGYERNIYAFSNELMDLTLIAQNRFLWIEKFNRIRPLKYLSQYIEKLLYFFGQCCIVYESGIHKVKRCYGQGALNQYGFPSKFQTMNYNGGDTKSYNFDSNDFVWIQNNFFNIPSNFWILNYCNRIANVKRIQDINLNAQKHPYLLGCTPETKLSIENLFKQVQDNNDAIFVDNGNNILTDALKVFNLNAPYIVDKLQDQYINEFSRALNFLGINTISEKRERLIESEGEITQELTGNYIDIFIKPRLRACKEVKEKMGIDLELQYNNDFVDYFKDFGGDKNGSLYNVGQNT